MAIVAGTLLEPAIIINHNSLYPCQSFWSLTTSEVWSGLDERSWPSLTFACDTTARQPEHAAAAKRKVWPQGRSITSHADRSAWRSQHSENISTSFPQIYKLCPILPHSGLSRNLEPYALHRKFWEGSRSKKIITNAAQGPNSDRGAKPSHPRCWGASQRLDAKLSAPFARQVKAMESAKLGMSTFDIFERYNRMNVRDSGNPWIELASTILQHVWGTWFNQLLTLRSCNQKEWTVAK